MDKDHKSLNNYINSDKVTVKNVGLKKKLLNRVGKVALSLSLASAAIVIGSAAAPSGAVDAAETAQEGLPLKVVKRLLIKP